MITLEPAGVKKPLNQCFTASNEHIKNMLDELIMDADNASMIDAAVHGKYQQLLIMMYRHAMVPFPYPLISLLTHVFMLTY